MGFNVSYDSSRASLQKPSPSKLIPCQPDFQAYYSITFDKRVLLFPFQGQIVLFLSYLKLEAVQRKSQCGKLYCQCRNTYDDELDENSIDWSFVGYELIMWDVFVGPSRMCIHIGAVNLATA